MKSLKDRIDEIHIDDSTNELDVDPKAPIPGTVFNERQARILKNAVIIMGLMLVGGFALLIGIIAYRASQPKAIKPPVAPAGVAVPFTAPPIPASASSASTTALRAAPKVPKIIKGMIPKDAVFLDSTINGNRLVLTLQTKNNNLQILHINLNGMQIVGEALLTRGK